jgi:hypothetical protein
VLVAGLAMEFVGENRAKRIADQENVRLIGITAKAERDAANANVRVEELRNENARLQAKLQPRTISPEKRAQLINCLSNGAKGKVFITWSWLDFDSESFGGSIINVLTNSGFTVAKYDGHGIVMSIESPGLSVTAKDLEHAPQHGRAITDCFSKFELPMTARRFPGLKCETNEILISVGPRF